MIEMTTTPNLELGDNPQLVEDYLETPVAAPETKSKKKKAETKPELILEVETAAAPNIFPIEFYKKSGIHHCPKCGDKKHSINGEVFCPLKDSQCPLIAK